MATAFNHGSKRKWESENTDIDTNLIWQDLKDFNNSFTQYRNQTIEKWHQKVQASTGGLATQKKFKVINQVSVNFCNNLVSFISNSRFFEK